MAVCRPTYETKSWALYVKMVLDSTYDFAPHGTRIGNFFTWLLIVATLEILRGVNNGWANLVDIASFQAFNLLTVQLGSMA
jgi:hypothetical protein